MIRIGRTIAGELLFLQEQAESHMLSHKDVINISDEAEIWIGQLQSSAAKDFPALHQCHEKEHMNMTVWLVFLCEKEGPQSSGLVT